jgi:hypothetical protein
MGTWPRSLDRQCCPLAGESRCAVQHGRPAAPAISPAVTSNEHTPCRAADAAKKGRGESGLLAGHVPVARALQLPASSVRVAPLDVVVLHHWSRTLPLELAA